MSDHLIVVDGYNLILRSPALKPGPDRTLKESRDKLVNLLSWALGQGDARFLVVFDGQHVSGSNENSSRVEVRYSKPPRKADDDIRAIVEDQVERVDRLTVVTADLEVARHARAMGANVALADLFLASTVGSAAGGTPAAGEVEKPGTLSKKEVEEWAQLFKERGTGVAPDEDAPETP